MSRQPHQAIDVPTQTDTGVHGEVNGKM